MKIDIKLIFDELSKLQIKLSIKRTLTYCLYEGAFTVSDLIFDKMNGITFIYYVYIYCYTCIT